MHHINNIADYDYKTTFYQQEYVSALGISLNSTESTANGASSSKTGRILWEYQPACCDYYILWLHISILPLSPCSHPLTRAALPPVPSGVHKTPGARRAMVTRNLLMLKDISGM